MALRELTNVNTQVRRLGYFPALLRLACNQNLGTDILSTRFEAWGRKHQSHLKEYTNTTGDIVPSKKVRPSKALKSRLPQQRIPNAIRVYVEFSHLIGWLTQISGVEAITRIGRILPTLDKVFTQDSYINPFVLPLYRRLFFIYELWRQDADVLSTVIHQISSEPTPLKRLQEGFAQSFQNHLNQRIRAAVSETENTELLERSRAIDEWQSPARYAEQFVPTRLNWLHDLGLARFEPRSNCGCYLTPEGQLFRERLNSLEAFADGWSEKAFFKRVADCFTTDGAASLPFKFDAEHKSILTFRLKETLELFRSGPVPKFSVPQVTLFLSILMLGKENIAVDRNDILEVLSQAIPFDDNQIIETRMSARENEAYIILNPI